MPASRLLLPKPRIVGLLHTTSMSFSEVLDALSAAHESISKRYLEHRGAVRELQSTLLEHVLPGVLDEVAVDGLDTDADGVDWLRDSGAIVTLKIRLGFFNRAEITQNLYFAF
jgi:hypothetical protein